MLRSVWRTLASLFHRPDSLAEAEPARARLVVGLGNPGSRYADTRHNVGFWCVERLARQSGAAWQYAADLRSDVALARLDDTHLVLARPRTYMNLSGEAAVLLLRRLDLPLERLLVVYDDMDLPLGTLRLRPRGSPGTHNGMRSLVALLGSEEFARLRIGVGQARRDARDYVLSPFEPDERPLADAAVEHAAEAARCWATEGTTTAMNRYNRAVAATGAAHGD